MSKRFGRNQRRRAHEQMERQQQQIDQQQLEIRKLYKNQRNPFEPDFPPVITREILHVGNIGYMHGESMLHPNVSVEQVKYRHLSIGIQDGTGMPHAAIGFIAEDNTHQFAAIYIDPRQIVRAEHFKELKNLSNEISDQLLRHLHKALRKQGR